MAAVGAHSRPGRHLPLEVLFRIVDFISLDRVLSFRSICRSFRNHIDTHVMYAYLQRTELIAHLESPARMPGPRNTAEQHPINILRASFSHVENLPDTHAQHETLDTAKWKGSYAVFDLDARWFRECWELLRRGYEEFIKFIMYSQIMRPRISPESEGFGWFVKLDGAILDLHLDLHPQQSQFNFTVRKIRVEWRTMLKIFLRTEAEISRRREEHHPRYTYDQLEDCIRTVRRERYIQSVRMSPHFADQCMYSTLKVLPTLFGRPNLTIAPWGFPYGQLLSWFLKKEEMTMRVIMYVRNGHDTRQS